MIAIEHSLKFVTEFDETHPVAQRFLMQDEKTQIAILEGLLKEVLAPELEPALEKINERGTYAILKVVR